MNKLKKILLIISFPVLFIAGVFVGKIIESIIYKVPLAGCKISQLPINETYSTINLDVPTKKMFQNYYSRSLNFTEYYVPENISAATHLKTFGYGSFHYFKVTTGEIYQCGFYK